MGHAFLLAALPPLGRQMGLGDMQTGMLLSLGAAGLLLAAPAWGRVSESWGRRPVILTGLLCAALASVAYGVLAQAGVSGSMSIGLLFGLFVAARLMQAFGGGGIMPAAQAVMADTTSEQKRSGGMGFMGAAFGLGAVLGAATLMVLAQFGTHWGFYAIGLLTVLGFLTCFAGLKEPQRGSGASPADLTGIYWGKVWPCLTVTILAILNYGILQQITGLRLQDDFGFTGREAAGRAGGALTASALAMVLAQAFVVGRLPWEPWKLVRLGASLAGLGMLSVAWAGSYGGFALGMAVVGFGIGVMLPSNLAAMSLRTGPDAQGKIAGVNAIGQGLGMIGGPAVGASLYQAGIVAPYFLGAAIYWTVALGALLLRERRVG